MAQGFCTQCGAALKEGSAFCTECGAQVAASTPSIDTSTTPAKPATNAPATTTAPLQTAVESTPTKNKAVKTGVIIAIAVVTCIVVGVIAFILGSQSAESPSNEQTSTTSAQEPAQETAAPEEDKVKINLPWGYIECSDLFDAEVDDSGIVYLKSAKTGESLCEVFPEMERHDGEDKHYSVKLGRAYANGSTTEVYLYLYYLTSDGRHAYWGSKMSDQLGLERAGITFSQLANAIYLNTKTSAEPIDPSIFIGVPLSYPSEEEASSAPEQKQAFYGIWGFASKNKSEADVEAAEAKKQGFDAQVFLSNKWSNLNSGPWYCVTFGTYSTEAEAKAALSKVKAAGYSDVYVKYSGTYRG